MSANTSITEGGKARPFGPVAALMVKGDNKYYAWVPESERQLDTLIVDKNGVYQASKLGVYGWSSVRVNVPQTEGVTGKDPTTGDDVYVRPDPETGELVETVVPTEIRVITPPDNPYGTYVDGQTITADGMVVKAYDAKGNEMQTVPNGEITLYPNIAHYDSMTDRLVTSTEMDISPWPNPMSSGVQLNHYGKGQYYDKTTGERLTKEYVSTIYDGRCCGIETPSGNKSFLFASSETPIYTRRNIRLDANGVEYEVNRGTNIGGNSYTHDQKTVYYVIANFDSTIKVEGPINAVYQSGQHITDHIGEAAWSMIYGTVLARGSVQTITVSWPRPGDGAILETTFQIIVGPHGGTGED